MPKVLTDGAARDLTLEMRKLERKVDFAVERFYGMQRGGRADVLIGKTQQGGITARSGVTLGSGTVDVQRLNNGGQLSDAGWDETLWNVRTDSLGEDVYVTAYRDWQSGLWLVDIPTGINFWRFSLTENMGNSTADEATATIEDMSGNQVTTGTIDDRLTNFRELKNTDEGFCVELGGEYFPLLAERRHRYQIYVDVTAHQSITTGGETKITAQSNSEFQPARFDGDSVGDLRQNSSERIFEGLTGNEFKYAGRYRCAYNVQFVDNSPPGAAHNHQFEVYFKLGGTQVVHSITEFFHDGAASEDFHTHLTGWCVVNADADESLELFVNRTSANTLAIDRWVVEVEDLRT